jgi:serine protease Do
MKILFLFVLIFSFNLNSSDKIWQEKITPAPYSLTDEIYKAQNSFVKIAEEINPAVVNISSIHTYKTSFNSDVFRMFEDFFGRDQRKHFRPQEREATALGSGVIIDKSGYILTNNHVIDKAKEIKVKLLNGEEYKAKVIGTDPEIDIALIKVNTKEDLPFVYLGKSKDAKVGQWVLALGNPVGQSNTVTAGIISSKGRVVPELSIYSDFIQTDAAINPGNSGGPLVNTSGEVIAINTAINRSMGGIPIEGIGFAVPVDKIKKVLPDLKSGKIVARTHAWLGVYLGNLTPDIAKKLKLKENQKGALVTEVMENAPAKKSGIKSYDLIVGFDNKTIESSRDLAAAVKTSKVGSKHKIKILRDGKNLSFNVLLEKEKETKDKKMRDLDNLKLGVFLENITNKTIKKYNLKGIKSYGGVLITEVQSGSPAKFAGLKVGDIIVEVNRKKIKNKKDFYRYVNKNGGNLFKILRDDMYIVLSIEY